MSTAIYVRGERGDQNLFSFNDDVSQWDIRREMEEFVREVRGFVLAEFLISTTRGDYWYSDIESLVNDIGEFSVEMNG